MQINKTTMKKIILLAIFMATFTTYAQAPRGWYGTLGATQSELASKDISSDPGIGIKGGLTIAMGYHESFNYQLELLYNRKTFNFNTISADYSAVEKKKYLSEALDLGFYFNYYVMKPDQDTFFFGPQIGGNVSFAGQFTRAKDDGIDPKILPYLMNDNSFSNESKVNFDAGFGITGGYNNFKFDLRYTKGLNNRLGHSETNSYTENNEYTGPTLSGKVNSISLTVSYLFLKRIKKISNKRR